MQPLTMSLIHSWHSHHGANLNFLCSSKSSQELVVQRQNGHFLLPKVNLYYHWSNRSLGPGLAVVTAFSLYATTARRPSFARQAVQAVPAATALLALGPRRAQRALPALQTLVSFATWITEYTCFIIPVYRWTSAVSSNGYETHNIVKIAVDNFNNKFIFFNYKHEFPWCVVLTNMDLRTYSLRNHEV